MTTQRTNRYAQTCDRCDAIVPAAAGLLYWEAGPDDGGDVAGRTRAGWRVAHQTDAECTAARQQAQMERRQTQASLDERYVAWVQTAPAIETVDTAVEHDSYGRELHGTLGKRGAVVINRDYPLQPSVYRPRPDGRFDLLGTWQHVHCWTCSTRVWPDEREGWTTSPSGSWFCPNHPQQTER